MYRRVHIYLRIYIHMNELLNYILLLVNIHPCCKNAEGTDVH